MLNLRNFLSIIFWCGLVAFASSQQCGKCMSNFASCIDDTSYYFCVDGQNPMISSRPNICAAGTYCTDSPAICSNVGNRPCQAVAACNDCQGGRRFTCASKTQFGFCANNQVAVINSCPNNQICSTQFLEQFGQICAPADVLSFYKFRPTCDAANTVAPPTVAIPSDLNIQWSCYNNRNQAKGGRYFYINNEMDNDCRSYIYCELRSNIWRGVLYTCQNGYFDKDARKCVPQKPISCLLATTTPIPATTSTTTSTTPAPTVPTPSTPAPVEPAPSTPSPEEPAPSTPAPVEPAPSP